MGYNWLMTRERLLMVASLIGIGLVFAFAFLAGKIVTKIERPVEEVGAASVPLTQPAPQAPAASDSYTWYSVTRVVDGDTAVVHMNGVDTKLRLIGLDTPEVVDPRKPVQCFGREASAKAHQILDGQTVRLEFDPSQGTLDKYGRTLAYIFLHDGTNFNEYVIAEGYGHEYTYHLPYKYQKEFKAAEAAAREAEKGLWAPGVCQ